MSDHTSPASDRQSPGPRSKALYQAATEVIPGGVNSPVRAFKSVGGTPVYFASASGSQVTDVDGQTYTDFCLSWGPLILGHADPDVVRAVQEAAPLGLSYGACHAAEVEMAQTITACFPGFDMARLVSSGTEAVMTALRLARGATGRPLIVKFDGGFHGHVDSLLVKAGSGLITLADPGTEASSAGVPKEMAHLTVTVPLADLGAVRDVMQRVGSQVAAIVIEPLPANNGLLQQTSAFLLGLRELCDQYGSLLIFDEVISGFRLHRGGYGALVGVQPDLVTLGKIVGGGMPVGAVTGPRKLLSLLAPIGPVYQAGTLSGNPIGIAAGLATLRKLADGSVYEHLERLGQRLEANLAASGIDWLRGRRVGSLFWPYFDAAGEVPVTAGGIGQLAVQRFNAMYHGMLQAGFYLPPSAYEVLFLCAQHTQADIDALTTAWINEARKLA